ncbi:MAG: ABC transporter permease [Desulfobacula sp.]|uniref:ABC transporter permease n=1 Tax=Desulfobacula sp. TaxID=2593537 RepID=UPI0025C03EDB|nr:ABC transporter permease [Desulfobacula sp.]MCD4719112.1 ABC transporter permease [Desulfobacula sp.]
MILRILFQLVKRLAPIFLTILFIVWLYTYYGAWDYTIKNLSEFFRLILEHFILVIISMFCAVIVGVTLGTIMTRKSMEKMSSVIMAVVNVWQSVPSLGVLALAYGFLPLIGLSGIGMVPALIALFFHAVAPIVRNTYAGIESVSKDVIEAATGMGMTKKQILFQIELPNAMPVIAGGIRTSTAIIVGTAPLAFLIGGGGLGFWIFTGIALVDMGIMMAGAVPVALIAMLFDYCLGVSEKFLVSRGVRTDEIELA